MNQCEGCLGFANPNGARFMPPLNSQSIGKPGRFITHG